MAENTVKQVTEYDLAAQDAFTDKPSVNLDTLSPLGVRLLNEFRQAELDRNQTETRWLKDLRQFKGIYEPDVEQGIGKRSKAFVRKTRVKVKTVNARMMDLLFPANQDRNWSIDATPVPSIAKEVRAQLEQALGQNLQRQPTIDELKAVVQEYVKSASGKMANTIDDQLTETRYRKVAKEVIHSGNLYGTGILKGPLVEKKVRISYVRKGGRWQAKEESYTVPFVDHVPLWRFYPDMSATSIEDCRYTWEQHLMTRAGLLELADRPRFDRQAIIDYVQGRPDGEYTQRQVDLELRQFGERNAIDTSKTGLYEVLERWGWVTADDLLMVNVRIPENRRHESFFAQVWMLPNGTVIKAALQPITGATFPYHFYYFDKDETSLFGEGVAAIMRDDQEMLNAGVRMLLDNAAIAAGPQLEVNVRALSNRENVSEMYPFKIWQRNGEDANSPAIRVIDLPAHMPELSNIIAMFEANADETTAIPRYMTGENVTNGAAGTASGLSMLMGASGIVLKDLVVNFDEGVTRPFVTALYRWNMRFNPDDGIKGDYDVKARGAASLVAKEVRSQTLGMFAQSLQPEERQYIKWDELVRARAETQELGNILKTADEVQAEQNNPQAQQMQQLQQAQAQLEMAKLQAMVAKLQAEVSKINAQAVDANVRAAYAAMQAGAVAVQNPNIAPAGDAILQSAGWKDATPEQGTITPEQGMPAPEMPASPGVGANAGIETPAVNDSQAELMTA
jgi:hypothetical protein